MSEHINTVVIGGGQAGLSISYYLTQQGRDHVVLEQQRIGESWRSKRWDSFTLVTPNWATRLPGFPYQGHDPDGFLPRSEIVAYLERYAAHFHLPVRSGVRVRQVEQQPDGSGYTVTTDSTTYDAANVVVATGAYQQPRIPAWSKALPAHITQLHTEAYRNPQALPPGAVLVVGTGQSGCQIAEELYQSGRKVYLSVGSAGRAPRRYRGKDAFWWLNQVGFFERTVDKLPSPKARFAGVPHVTGKDGGHTLNLHQFARDGVTLLGRAVGAEGNAVILAPDLQENLAKADKFAAEIYKAVDEYVLKTGMDVPTDDASAELALQDGFFQGEPILRLDLVAAGITSVIWGTGYRFDFSWVRLPVCDEDGFPVQQRGVTAWPGLYFLGLQWLHTMKSGILLGVGEDAAYLADYIARRG